MTSAFDIPPLADARLSSFESSGLSLVYSALSENGVNLDMDSKRVTRFGTLLAVALKSLFGTVLTNLLTNFSSGMMVVRKE